MKYVKKCFVFCMIISLLVISTNTSVFASGPENSIPPHPVDAVLDLVVARPIGVVATVAGLGLFLCSWPFTIFNDGAQSAAHTLVVTPGHWTFQRPLGKF